MSLSFDQVDKLDGHRAILTDRTRVVELALEKGPRTVAELDEIAVACVEILEAAQAIEILCARAARSARWAAQQAFAAASR